MTARSEPLPDSAALAFARRYLDLWQENMGRWATDPLNEAAPPDAPAPPAPTKPTPPPPATATQKSTGKNSGTKKSTPHKLAAEPATPRPRLGPRPLPFHTAMTGQLWTGAVASLPGALVGQAPWHPAILPRAEKLLAEAPGDMAAAMAAAGVEALERLTAFLAGVDAYRNHPHHRALSDPPVVWQEGSTKLRCLAPNGRGPALLVVPSLVNRWTVLDLSERQSVLRALAARGFRPFVIDWDEPGAEELGFGLDDYITRRLVPALAFLEKRTKGPIGLVGYCMGGLLALGLHALRPKRIGALSLLAVPWDFHAGQKDLAIHLSQSWGQAVKAAGAGAALNADQLQLFFTSLDPTLVERKFRRFAGLDPSAPGAQEFIDLEDWANDGVPLPGPVAGDVLALWYGENAPARDEWVVAGTPVRPGAITCPAQLFIPAGDKIVPPASARALARAIPGADARTPPAGHVGMVTGRQAATQLIGPMAEFLGAALKG